VQAAGVKNKQYLSNYKVLLASPVALSANGIANAVALISA
jgi:hypothetical protein